VHDEVPNQLTEFLEVTRHLPNTDVKLWSNSAKKQIAKKQITRRYAVTMLFALPGLNEDNLAHLRNSVCQYDQIRHNR
jgi:hypothetical protein